MSAFFIPVTKYLQSCTS